jgi:hypothetical protein
MIEYCRGDVDATAEVTRRISEEGELSDPLTLEQALIRGFYMAAAAWVTHTGLPIDMPLYWRLSVNASALRSAYIAAHNDRYPVFKADKFNLEKFDAFLEAKGWLATWPRTPTGKPLTNRKILERMAHKEVDALLEFLATVDLLERIGSTFDENGEIEEDSDKAKGIQLCPDGRIRASLFPFGTKTSRNAVGPKALFQNPAWMRFLIRPEPGRAVVYLDYITQEPRIAAAFSGDRALARLCEYDDYHMAMVVACGVAPPGATKKTHRLERRTGKTLGMAMLYGGGARMVMNNAETSRPRAVHLLRSVREMFPDFFRWSDAYAFNGLSAAPILSPLGWRYWPRYWKGEDPPDRTARNFPAQSAAADVMRIAAIRAFERGIPINAIVHDAFVVEAAIEDVERIAEEMREIMGRAGEDIIGVCLPAKPYIVRHGEQFFDDDGEEDFKLLMSLQEEIENAQEVAWRRSREDFRPCHRRKPTLPPTKTDPILLVVLSSLSSFFAVRRKTKTSPGRGDE